MKIKMLRKFLTFGIIILLIGVNAILSVAMNLTENPTFPILSDDQLDQYQTECNGGDMLVGSFDGFDTYVVQTFVPQRPILTRVELYIKKWDYYPPNHPFQLAIRDSLTGNNLVVTSVNPSDISFSSSWVEFDFDDIGVTIGDKYYIHSFTEIYPTFGGYLWGFSSSNPYPQGMEYHSWNGGGEWYYYEDRDMCFKTYGKGAPPDKPTINGPASGYVDTSYNYEFISIDPDGDNVSYYIKWGDGTITDWTSFQDSGPPGFNESHTWSIQGTYIIKAKTKDVYGLESDWSEYRVSIPRNRTSTYHWLLNCFPLLERLLNLFG
jgi:hypothetical protein